MANGVPDLPPPFQFGTMPPTQQGLGIGTAIGIGGRNQALSGFLQQILGPSLQDIYEAGPVSGAASQYRASRQTNLSGLAQRGLATSGAVTNAQRGLEQLYSGAVLSAIGSASQAESQRKQTLLSSILGVSASDLSFIQALNRGALGQSAAQAQADVASLESTKYLGTGVASLVATIAGGVAGGAGGLGGVGATGAAAGAGGAAGAAQGALYGQALSGAIGGGSGAPGPGLMGFSGYQAPQYSYPSAPTGGVSGGPSTQSLISNLGLTLADRF